MKTELPDDGRCLRLGLISNQAFSLINFRGELIREMVSRGVAVYALASDYVESTRAQVAALGACPVDYSLSRTGMNPLRDIRDVVCLVSALKKLHLDIVFACFIKPVIYGMLAARIASVKRRFALVEGVGYVFTKSDESETFQRRALREAVMKMYRVGLSQAHKVFMLNPDDIKFFVDNRMVAYEKVTLLSGIGVDLTKFPCRPVVCVPLTFLFIARLLREKGTLEFVAAARSVKAKSPSVRFVMLGGLDENPGAISERDVKAWVAEGIVEWPGMVADVRPWIERASVFVLPSYREGLPRSTQECMAMGRPVITTDVPGCRETVDEGVNGFMVRPRDANALAHAMMRFVDMPALLVRMGSASRAIAEKNFDVSKTNDLMLKAMGIVGSDQ